MPAIAESSTASQQLAEALRAGIVDRWQPFPWQVPALVDESPVVLLTGSVGGGKSRLWQQMVHEYCTRFPGAFVLVARKTRESMSAGSMLALADVAGAPAQPVGSTLRYPQRLDGGLRRHEGCHAADAHSLSGPERRR